MNRRTAVLLAAFVSCAALAFASGGRAWAGDSAKRAIDREVDLAGARSLAVRAGAGEIRVRSTLARRQARPDETAAAPAPHGASATIHLELYGAAADIAGVTLDVTRDGDQVIVQVNEPKQRGGWFTRSANVGATCSVVLAADVDVELRTGSGDIVVDGPPRGVTASAGSGRISVTAPHAAADLHTGSGDVVVRGATSSLTMRTGSGSIQAALSGEWSGTSIRAQTGSGDVRLAVPPGFHADLQTHTGSGTVTNDARIVSANSPLVSVRTGSGNVRIANARE